MDSWLPLPDVAERLGLDVGKVRRLLQDRVLVAVRLGERRLLCVPEALVADGAPLPDLKGTLTVLTDSGFDDEESLRWLFTPDDTLPGTPVTTCAGAARPRSGDGPRPWASEGRALAF